MTVSGRCYVSCVDGVDARKGLKSLEVILEEVRIDRAAQLQHFDALDSKAGIVLGFSGAVAALAPSRAVCRGHRSAHRRAVCSQRHLDVPPEDLRSEEHTSELQSHHDLVCRLLLEKKKK